MPGVPFTLHWCNLPPPARPSYCCDKTVTTVLTTAHPYKQQAMQVQGQRLAQLLTPLHYRSFPQPLLVLNHSLPSFTPSPPHSPPLSTISLPPFPLSFPPLFSYLLPPSPPTLSPLPLPSLLSSGFSSLTAAAQAFGQGRTKTRANAHTHGPGAAPGPGLGAGGVMSVNPPLPPSSHALNPPALGPQVTNHQPLLPLSLLPFSFLFHPPSPTLSHPFLSLLSLPPLRHRRLNGCCRPANPNSRVMTNKTYRLVG